MVNKSDNDIEKGVKSTTRTENESIEDEENNGRTIPGASRSSKNFDDGKRYVYDAKEGRFGRWIEKTEEEEIEEGKKESGQVLGNRCLSCMTFQSCLKLLFVCACVVAFNLLFHLVWKN